MLSVACLMTERLAMPEITRVRVSWCGRTVAARTGRRAPVAHDMATQMLLHFNIAFIR